MVDSVTGQSGTRVLSRVVPGRRLEPGTVLTQHRHMVGFSALEKRWRARAVMKDLALVTDI